MYYVDASGEMYFFSYHRILLRLSEAEGWTWVPRVFTTANEAHDYAWKYFRGIKREYVKVVAAENEAAAEELRLNMNKQLNLKPIEEWDGKFSNTELNHMTFIRWLRDYRGMFSDDNVMDPLPASETEPLPTVEVN